MTLVVVKPAGVGQENKWLLLLVIAILAVSAAVIFSANPTESARAVVQGQLDSRDDLSAIEQGLYADLESAAEEIRWLLESGDDMPSVAQLAENLIPPFMVDAVSAERGEHQWQHLVVADTTAIYLGSTNNPEAAGSFMLKVSPPVLSASKTNTPTATAAPQPDFSIWYNPQSVSLADLGSIEQLQPSELKHHQWLQVVSHYNASVTRHGTN